MDGVAWRGNLLVLASSAAFASAGYFTRLVTADSWTVLFWRGVFGGLFIGAFALVRQGRGAFRRIGWPGLAVAACSAVATVCFINALRRTSVADVTLINAACPFAAAALGIAVLREREPWTRLLASLLALAGVAWMMGGAARQGHLAGDLLALAMTLLIALMMVIIRAHRATDMLPAASLSAFASAMLAFPVAHPLAVDGVQLGQLAVFGTAQFGLGLMLLTLGSRLVPPARAALLGNVEIPLGPLLVWAAFGEVPAWTTLAGGVLVVAAVGFDLGCDAIGKKQAVAASPEGREAEGR